jgi:hypothetical protein
MKVFRSARWLLLALLLPLIPATQAHAGVFISVNFGPPVLPVYVQPVCPDPDLIWTPGYWAYGPDGYYWVPGAWVPAPYVGALWTPPYWGYEGSLYLFHPGYWGPHVGYYGGVNYGFGYMGVGFVGGMWGGGHFRYNTAVMNVNRGYIRNVYEDRNIVERNTIRNDRRVAFSGGPGGINHPPSAAERSYMSERHMAPTSFQSQHMEAARNDRTSYARANNGRPQNLVAQRPLQAENRQAPAVNRPGFNGGAQRPANNSVPGNRPAFNNNERSGSQSGAGRPAFNQTQQRSAEPSRPAVNQAQRPAASQPAQQRSFSQPQQREAPSRPAAPQQRENFSRPAAPQQHAAPQQRSAPQEHPHGPHGR